MKVWRPACFEEQVSVLALLWRCFPRAQQAAKGVRAQTICGNRLLSAMRFTSAMVHSTPVEGLLSTARDDIRNLRGKGSHEWPSSSQIRRTLFGSITAIANHPMAINTVYIATHSVLFKAPMFCCTLKSCCTNLES